MTGRGGSGARVRATEGWGVEEQGARARAGQSVLSLYLFLCFFFLADWGEGYQGALLGSALPAWDGMGSCTKIPPLP